VRQGKIAFTSAGAANAQGMRTIDAKGMTAVAGLIDAHRHVNTGPNEKAQMEQLLEAGYTAVLSGGGPADGNITLRDHIEKGLIKWPTHYRDRIGAVDADTRPGSRRIAQYGRHGHQVYR
jgi:predicted amidohydrolase